jgi:hypothetical protein
MYQNDLDVYSSDNQQSVPTGILTVMFSSVSPGDSKPLPLSASR